MYSIDQFHNVVKMQDGAIPHAGLRHGNRLQTILSIGNARESRLRTPVSALFHPFHTIGLLKNIVFLPDVKRSMTPAPNTLVLHRVLLFHKNSMK